jgi:hypothetical protein
MTITVQPTTDCALIEGVMAALLAEVTWDQAKDLPAAGLLVADPDVFVLHYTMDGVSGGITVNKGSDTHTLFLPHMRGSKALAAARAGIAWVWSNTRLDSLTTMVLSNRKEVLLFTRLLGFELTTTTDHGDTQYGVPVQRHHFILRRP